MPKNSIVRNEQTSTKSSNKTASKRATKGANVVPNATAQLGGAAQHESIEATQNRAEKMQEIGREYPSNRGRQNDSLDVTQSHTQHALYCTVGVDGEAMRLSVSMDIARQALEYIDPQDRTLWVTMGQALKSAYGDDGLPLFCEWCATIVDYYDLDGDAVKSAYRAFNVEGGVSIGTLIYEAVQRGFDPKAHGATPSTDQEPIQSHAPESKLNDSERMKFELLSSTIVICQAIEGLAIELENSQRGLLCLRVVVSNSLDNEQSRLMRDGGVSVLNGIDFVSAVPVFMPWILDKADCVRLCCSGDVSKREPYLLCDGREYAFDINSANELVTVELFIDAFAVSADWLVENIAPMFERLAFEIDACIEFVNQRRERGYFNA